MRKKAVLLVVLLGASVMFAKQSSKPQIDIKNIEVLPSEPVRPTGTCKSSTAGYLEIEHRTTLSDKEIGGFAAGYLHDGYIVKIYPVTKRGTFVYLECTNAMNGARP